ncbi:MAG TPA: TetR/AcrR family transcriptional regulator [Ktedonobacterales bacterium]|nr:TetR/AcrR family transcriptional regulator [Ktedonobacterales bacterium]
MGRPKTYGERAARDLLEAAERIVAAEGLDALSVRRVASASGTTTRAVYSVYGSKDGLVVALGTRAFHLLQDALEALPTTSDPAADLVEAGALVFRRFALDHPALLRIGFLRVDMTPELACQFRDAADQALVPFRGRFTRLAESGRLDPRSVAEAMWAFQALCEGLAALELRCEWPSDSAERIWRNAFGALVAGWRVA